MKIKNLDVDRLCRPWNSFVFADECNPCNINQLLAGGFVDEISTY